MGLIEISVLIIAIAFCFLVFYFIRVLKSVEQSLNETEKAIVQIKTQVDEMGKETTQLLHNTNQVILDVDKKSQSLNPMFQTVEEVGQAAQQLSSSIMQVSSALSKSVKEGVMKSTQKNQDTWSRVFQAISLGYFLTRKWKQRKKV